MTSVYQILLNNGKIVTVSAALFEKLPEDSMLYNLLKADQEMAKKDEIGNYLLCMDHPDMFEFALQSIEKPDLNCYDLHSATRASYHNFLDAMNAFVSTLDYLQFPIPEPYKAFVADYSSFMPPKRGERISKSIRRQICEIALSLQERMIQKGQILWRNSLAVGEARRMKNESLEMETKVVFSVYSSNIFVKICAISGWEIEEMFETAKISDLEQDFKDAGFSPLYVLFEAGNIDAQAILNEYFVPVFLDTFCKINSVKLVSFGSSLENIKKTNDKLLKIDFKVDLRE